MNEGLSAWISFWLALRQSPLVANAGLGDRLLKLADAEDANTLGLLVEMDLKFEQMKAEKEKSRGR